MKPSVAIVAASLMIADVSGQIPRMQPHPEVELEIPAQADPAWASIGDTCRVSFATIDLAFPKHDVPKVAKEIRSWSGIAWRGERVHAQFLVWSKKPLTQLRAASVSLTSVTGETIPSSAVRIRFVRYVLSERPPGSQNADCGENETQTAYLVPDILDSTARLDLAGSTVRPVWITIDVPRAAPPGVYSGTIEVRTAESPGIPLKLELEALAGRVPATAEWSFRVDLWQNPWAVARQHRVQPWSPAHLALLREHLRTLADMGQTYVSAYITDSPWHDDTYVADGNMVEWIRELTGKFSFDYCIFDTYVELAMSAGISKAISCFTMIPWNGRVRYLDRKTGEYRWETWATESPEYEHFWRAFLADLRSHLLRKGWFPKTYLEVNERSLEDTVRAIKLARSDSPAWKFTYAGNHHPELLESVDDLCTVLGHETPAPEILARRDRRQTTTFYVCCNPPFPNDFAFSPPVENVWMGWHAAALGMDGFLRWAWDSWPADPLLDSRHVRFPAGDTFLVYPGPLASIRMERLREGFVDYEKLRLVRKTLETASSPQARQALDRLDAALRAFSWERVSRTGGSTIAEDIRAAREALNAATRIAFR